MFSEYKNILANKFMRDTNYIIIKDTDDLEELERQWELFQSQLTVRQQRLSDDRSIEIWNMTNQKHYEALKELLMGQLEDKLNIDSTEDKVHVEYEPEDDDFDFSGFNELENFDPDDEDFHNMVNIPDEEVHDDENEITEPVKEESVIPTDGRENMNKEHPIVKQFNDDKMKNAQADQYEIDSNINIIGSVKGNTYEEKLQNLEKAFRDWNSQNQDHRKKSDDKCREIYGMSNIDRYNKLKDEFYKRMPAKDLQQDKTANPAANVQIEAGSFVDMVSKNMQIVNEEESKSKQHRRFNDTPYFTPSEMIDLGVHDNDNFYCTTADNDGLIQGTKIPLWFDSYKSMCLDHIFEDYTKEWIDTLDVLYSDFDKIKESGDETKIAARKQSILDLGWNPEIPFTRRNRKLAAKRVNKLLDKSSPLNLFVNLNKEVTDEDVVTDTPVNENAKKNTHQPVYIVFVQGKAPIISNAIKKITNSPYSHSGISFSSKLDAVHSYNMLPNPGIVKESIEGYKDKSITVMAFFAPNQVYNSMKDYVIDFWVNSKKTVYDWGIIFNKVINKNARVVEDKYHQVCSTFVDAVMKSSNVVMDKTANVPSPAELYNSAKTMPNKIIEVYSGPADKYDADKVEKKMNKLLEQGKTQAIDEGKIINKLKSKKADMGMEINALAFDALSHLTNNKEKKEDLKKKANSCRAMKGLLDEAMNLDSSEYNDIYHNIEDWESGKSNLIWITGLSGSGKSTMGKEIASKIGADYVELDNLQRAKMDNWDTTGSKLMDDYIKSKGGLANVFSYVNNLETITWKDIVSNETECPKQFDEFFNYIISYANKNKTKRFVVEGVQLAMCSKDTTINKIAGYPVILKMNGPLKTEFRREKRTIKTGLEKNDSLINILKKVAHRHKCWWQQDFYKDDWKEVNYFRTHIGEAALPSGVTLRKATKADVEYMYNCEMESIDPSVQNDKKVMKLIRDDVNQSIGITKIIQYNGKDIGMLTTDSIDNGERWYIGEIYIDKEYRGRGIGSSLLKNELENHDKVRLQVAKSNTSAISLYKSLGFEITKYYERGNMYIMDYEKEKPVKEGVSLLNEVKQFPIEFDKEGNLIIYKCRTGSVSYGDEIADSVKLLESYRNTNNIEGMKYELAKLWFINDSIEKKLKKRLTNDQYRELINHRATCLNVFKLNLEYVMKAEQGFNFSDYYNSTPFSDNSIKITANTLKYSIKALTQI